MCVCVCVCIHIHTSDFPGSSAGKQSTCNAGDPWLSPWSGRSPGEGAGYPLQYSWASLTAQSVKNLPAIWETWVQSLGWEDPLEENMAAHSDICAWRITVDGEAWWATVHVVTESDTPKHSSRIHTHTHIPITESDPYFVKYYFRIILHLNLDSK